MTDDLDDLEKKLARYRADLVSTPSGEGMNAGARAGVELVGCIGAGALAGWLLDRWLGTRPWGFLVLTLAGAATAFLNIYKISRNTGSSVGFAALHKMEKEATKTPFEKDGEDEE
jgi:ATP synthase protein I